MYKECEENQLYYVEYDLKKILEAAVVLCFVLESCALKFLYRIFDITF